MIAGKIAYLVRDLDYDDENHRAIPDSGTWELREHDPGYYSSENVKKIVYFEVE